MLLKSHKHRLKLAMELIEMKNEERLKLHVENFQQEVTMLCDVAKERHILFVEEVKDVEEFVKLKVVELKYEMSKVVAKLELNYQNLHSKMDVIVDAIKKLVEYNSLFSTTLEAKTTSDQKVFYKLEEFQGSLKESLSKLDLSQQSTVSQDSISKMNDSLESNLKVELGPLLQLVNLMPINVPPVKQVVQW